MATALLLTTWWRRIAVDGVEDRGALQREAERVEGMGSHKQTMALRKNLDEQVLRMFKAIHAAREAQSALVFDQERLVCVCVCVL